MPHKLQLQPPPPVTIPGLPGRTLADATFSALERVRAGEMDLSSGLALVGLWCELGPDLPIKAGV